MVKLELLMSFWTEIHLSWPLTLFTHFRHINCVYRAKQVANVILNLIASLLALNYYYQSISKISEANFPFISIQAYSFFNLNYFSLLYFTLIYLTLNLIIFIYSVLGLPLSNLSYIDLFMFWAPFIYWIYIEITKLWEY